MSDQAQSDDVPTAKPSMAPLPAPSKDNDWLGFCQSAIKLQHGDRKVGLKILLTHQYRCQSADGPRDRVLLRREQITVPHLQLRELRHTTAPAKDAPTRAM